jgi:hypothetical protein
MTRFKDPSRPQEGDGDLGTALGFVRHQLDSLAYSRLIAPLGTADSARYEELCQQEVALLRGACPLAHLDLTLDLAQLQERASLQ